MLIILGSLCNSVNESDCFFGGCFDEFRWQNESMTSFVAQFNGVAVFNTNALGPII